MVCRITCFCLLFTLLLAACKQDNSSSEQSPIAKFLQEDSIYRATIGDSTNKHVTFDYENLNRVVWQKPNVLVERMGDLSGKTVVEIGSGTGFFTRRLAQTADMVIALDIDPSMLLLLDSLNNAQLDSAAYSRIDPRLVPADDPNLGDQEADAALVVNTFMYIPKRADYLSKLARGLKSGSALLIVDFKKKSTPVGPPVASRLPVFDVEQALREAGFEQILIDDTTLDYQYIVRGVKP
ncbi:MAG: class I SAM-dependent methyltransferase [Saprospiraceae bacterium]